MEICGRRSEDGFSDGGFGAFWLAPPATSVENPSNTAIVNTAGDLIELLTVRPVHG
jgi:hypothetical protein